MMPDCELRGGAPHIDQRDRKGGTDETGQDDSLSALERKQARWLTECLRQPTAESYREMSTGIRQELIR
jgi:hypothetical protein